MVCTSCDSGMYANASGLSHCTACRGGQFQEKTGQSTCKDCPEGKRAKGSEAANDDDGLGGDQQLCFSEVFSGASRNCTCTQIQGFNSSYPWLSCKALTKQSSCRDCPSGKYNTKADDPSTSWTDWDSTLRECLPCEPGRYRDTPGVEGNCRQCDAGQYNNISEQTSCILCGTGKYAASGTTECTACKAGWIDHDYDAGTPSRPAPNPFRVLTCALLTHS